MYPASFIRSYGVRRPGVGLKWPKYPRRLISSQCPRELRTSFSTMRTGQRPNNFSQFGANRRRGPANAQNVSASDEQSDSHREHTSQFETTHWSLVFAAGERGDAGLSQG